VKDNAPLSFGTIIGVLVAVAIGIALGVFTGLVVLSAVIFCRREREINKSKNRYEPAPMGITTTLNLRIQLQ